MPSRFSGKLLRFLFAHLEQATFGERLLWLDRDAGIFQILWKHGNHVTTTPEEDNAVFTTWHDAKERKKPCDPIEAKQRFRKAARKMHLDHLKSWRDIFPSKWFQFWRFPPDDLAYLLKNADLDRHEHWKSRSRTRYKKVLLIAGKTCLLPTRTTWWKEAPTPQQLPVVIKQEPMSDSETESESDSAESDSESEPEWDPEPQQEVEPEVIKAEIVSDPEMDSDSEAEPAVQIKTEPEAEPETEPEPQPEKEPEPQPVKEPEPQPKTVQRTEAAIDRSKQQPAIRDSSPPSWQRRPRRCPQRKCFCCMEPGRILMSME